MDAIVTPCACACHLPGFRRWFAIVVSVEQRRRLRTRIFLIALGAFAQQTSTTVTSSDVIAHLEQVIRWRQQVNSVEQATAPQGGELLHDSAWDNSTTAVQKAFDYARAEAALLRRVRNQDEGAPAEAPEAGNRLQQAAQKAADRVNGIQSRIADVDAAIARARARDRDALGAQRNELQAALDLAKEVQSSIQSVAAFAGGSNGDAGVGGLSARINELAKTVPEAQHGASSTKPTAAAANAQSASSAFNAESAGIISLATQLFTLLHERGQVDDLLHQTDALLANGGHLKAPLVAEIRAAISTEDQLTASAASADAQALAAGAKQIKSLTARYGQVASALVPLGEETLAIQ